MSKLPGAIGPDYLTTDIQFDSQISRNFYLEFDEMQTGVDGEPWRGILRFGKTNAIGATTLPGPVRGSWVTSNNLCFFVAGSDLFQLTGTGPPFSVTQVGTLSTSVGPVDFADFGGLLCIVDGPYGYQYQNGAFTQITDPNFQGANTVVVFDGIFIFNVPNSIIFYYSGIDISSGLTFNGLDFDSKDGNSDPINGMLVFQRQLWVLGTQTGEIWVDNPGSTNQWQRLEGPYLQSGCAAFKTFKYSELGGNNGPIGVFLGQSPRGGPIVYMTTNYTVTRISTHPIEQYISQYSQYLANATAILYQINGHVFYQFSIPTMPVSWVYDITTSQLSGKPCWVGFTYTDSNNIETRDLADNSCYFNGYHLVGDYTNPYIYYLNANDYTDNNSTIKFTRRFPHIAEDYDIVWYNDVTLKIKTGQGLPCLAPTVPTPPWEQGYEGTGGGGNSNGGAFQSIVSDDVGLYGLALGGSGTVSTSDGGESWITNNEFPDPSGYGDILFNGTYFVVLGFDTEYIYFSTDLTTWSTNNIAYTSAYQLYQDPATQAIYFGTPGSGANINVYRIAPNANTVVKIIDTAPGPNFATYGTAVLTQGGITVSSYGVYPTYNPYYSTDGGVTWTISPTNFGSGNILYTLANNGSTWLFITANEGVMGTPTQSWTSTDGINWTQVASTTSTPPYQNEVLTFKGKFYQWQGNSLASSSDGITWSSQTIAMSTIIGITVSSTRMYVYGPTGILESGDGSTFSTTAVTKYTNDVVSAGMILAIASTGGAAPDFIYQRSL